MNKVLLNPHLSTSKMLKAFALFLSALFVLTGCQSSTPLEVWAVKKNVDFNQYRSIKVETLNDSERRIIGFINNAIESNLREKGYDISEQADLVVVYHVAIENSQRVDLKQVPTVKGNVFTLPKLEPVNKASILINAYDPKLDVIVWKASTIRDVTSVNPKKVDQERVNKRVEELFESFPDLENSSSLFY